MLPAEESDRVQIKSCPFCGKEVRYRGLGMYNCLACKKVFHDDYGKIREYLDDHGTSLATKVSEDVGVTMGAINNLLREGRLEIAPDSKVFLFCENCHARINMGHYCDKCAPIMAEKRAAEQERRAQKAKVFGMAESTSEGRKRFRIDQ